MPSHFSSVGFTVHSQEAFLALAQQAAKTGHPHSTPPGTYLQWDSGVGAQLWLQVSPKKDLIGMNPHFDGPARMKIKITSDVIRERQTPLDGAWAVQADPGGDWGADGCYPFVFDSPDFWLTKPSPGSIVEAQLAAFAHELKIFESEAAFDADGTKDQPKFAVESFIPSGLFNPGSGKSEVPQAHGIFTGRIIETQRRVNPLTQQAFYWALVKTLGGQFDVVADEALVTKPMIKGGVLSGSFWISGRIIIAKPKGSFKNYLVVDYA